MQQQQQQEISMVQSVAVMKNCIRLGISTIAFRRNLFPNSAFASKTYAGVNLEVIRPVDRQGQVASPGALQVLEWLELGCFKCLEAGYLDKLMFNILDRHPNDAQAVVLESYVFSVAAGGADTHAQVKKSAPNRVAITLPRVSKQDVHVSTQKLIKTLMLVTSSLPALPSVRWLSISIAYNALAPQGYQAPDFDPIDPKHDAGFAAGQAVEQVALGSVFTGHQHMSVQCCRAEASVSASAVGSTQRCEDAEDEDNGYHSDNTDLKWNKEKLELARQAEHVIKQAVRAGMCPKLALESSTQLSQAIPKALVQELVQRHQQPVVSYKRSKVT